MYLSSYIDKFLGTEKVPLFHGSHPSRVGLFSSDKLTQEII